MTMQKRFFAFTAIVFMLCFPVLLHGQGSRIDSLKTALKGLGKDTSRVNTLNALCWEQRISLPETALQYGQEAANLATALKFVNGEAKARNNMGVVYHLQGKYDKALQLYNLAIELYKTAGNDRALAAVLGNLASVWQAKGEYTTALDFYSQSISVAQKASDRQRVAIALGSIGIIYYDRGFYAKALAYYLHSLAIREDLGDMQGMAYALGNIGLIYDAQRNYPKALEYYYRSLRIRQQLDDKQGIATSLINIGMVHFAQQHNNEARDYFTQALRISEECGFKKGLSASLQNLGDVYRAQKEYQTAEDYFEKALQINQETEDMQGMANAWHSMGLVNKEQGRSQQALDYFTKSEDMARELDNKELRCNNLFERSQVFAGMGNYQKAWQEMGAYVEMKDSLYSEESMIKLADMEVKYESDKKEQAIRDLSNEKELQEVKIERNYILFYMSGALFLLLLGLAIALFYMYRHKQKVRRLTLVRESETTLRNMVVETEEKERKRFAKDLHDGLGPLLSAVKIYVNELQDDETPEAEKSSMLKYVNDLIDEAVRDTRTIANNLMPTMIADYGLVSALQAFCEKIQRSKVLSISFNANVLQTRLDATLEITLYRVLLELINNTIRHAAAKNIDIHILETIENVEISYKDDGCGFDVQAMLHSPEAGLGLRNIMNRIASVDGRCEFRSEMGKGLWVRMEIDKQKYYAGINKQS
jgi:signal transduction histidine kinase/Flp pilus assembly protein TadD